MTAPNTRPTSVSTYYATPAAAISDLRAMVEDIAANAQAASDPEMQIWADNISQAAHDFEMTAMRAASAPALVEALRDILNRFCGEENILHVDGRTAVNRARQALAEAGAES